MLLPMLASLGDASLTDPHLVYEPKYDGIRAIAEIGGGRARLWSRLGNEKTAQFPEIVSALNAWSRQRHITAVLDGEIVALDRDGEPTGFQQLQGRVHLAHVNVPAPQSSDMPRSASRTSRPAPRTSASPSPVAFICFDLLREGDRNLR